jgi:formate transporter
MIGQMTDDELVNQEAARKAVPPAQYLGAEFVIETMGEQGAERVTRFSVPQIFLLAVLGGAFITAGAIFSLLLGASVGSPGPQRLLEGLGFSTGFFFVILASAVLFTEANVTMPSVFLACRSPVARIARFWALAWLGNLVGALLIGGLITLAQDYPADVTGLLDKVIAAKLSWRDQGGVGAWFEIVVSGMLANWLVGMAAFFATMGRTIFGKYIPVFLAVTLFVAANFQHSPANMAYFSLAQWMGHGPGWGVALWWNIIPAGIGNLIGGTFFVALPLWYGLKLRA